MNDCRYCTLSEGEAIGGDHGETHAAAIRLLAGCEREEVAFAACGCHLTQEDDGDVALFTCEKHRSIGEGS